MRQWSVRLPLTERLDVLKQLWPLNYRYALELLKAAQLPKQENERMLSHWLRTGQHNTAQALIKRLQPVLGETTCWQIASQETLSPTMRDLMNYYGHGRLGHQPEENKPSRFSSRFTFGAPATTAIAE